MEHNLIKELRYLREHDNPAYNLDSMHLDCVIPNPFGSPPKLLRPSWRIEIADLKPGIDIISVKMYLLQKQLDGKLHPSIQLDKLFNMLDAYTCKNTDYRVSFSCSHALEVCLWEVFSLLNLRS